MLLIICVERLLHIGSHFSLRKWRRWPHFPTKLAAGASFSYKVGGGGKDLATLLAAVLTWSGTLDIGRKWISFRKVIRRSKNVKENFKRVLPF